MQKNLSLAECYKDYFDIGAAVNPGLIELGGDIIKSEFSSLTCENEMKFSSVHPKIDEYTFERADKVYNFAKENNLKMRGHTLVWHHQTDDWLFKNENGENVDKETLYKRMKEHISTVVKRYSDKVYCWDVVNEAISDKSDKFDSEENYLRVDSNYYLIVQSEEYLEKAFIYAHEADPNALLFYNDYSTEYPPKREKIYKLLKSLLDKGVPVHGMGLQGHYDLSVDIDELSKSIDLFASLGLTIHITELDISLYVGENDLNFEPPPEDRLKKQAYLYKKIFELLREKKDKIGNVTFWGVFDHRSWLNHFPVKNRKNYPLLFDADLKPKEAYYEVIDF